MSLVPYVVEQTGRGERSYLLQASVGPNYLFGGGSQ